MSERKWTRAELLARAECFDVGDWMADQRPSPTTAAMLRQGADALAEIDRLTAQVREADALKVDVEAMRVNLHATFNGGHHDEPARRAFHHGMDTVCNVLAAHQKREQTNGILPSPPAREGSDK